MTDKTHSDPDLVKTRRIFFAGLSTINICCVANILGELEHVEALPGKDGNSVVVVAEHKLNELESVLSTQGYRLGSNLPGMPPAC